MRNHLTLTLFTNDPKLARHADRAGVDRIGVDLEVIGKAERQKGLGSWLSQHSESDIPPIQRILSQAQLFARTNPINPGTKDEVNRLLDVGVQVLMLPMFTTIKEVAEFVAIVDGRAKVVPLLEHIRAAEKVEELVKIEGIDELHVGLLDLSLSINLHNRFAMLTTKLIEDVTACIRKAGIPFGVGGIGRACDNTNPIPSDLIYAAYPRLGATAALVSQAFRPAELSEAEFCQEIARTRTRMSYWFSRSSEEINTAHQSLCETLTLIKRSK